MADDLLDWALKRAAHTHAHTHIHAEGYKMGAVSGVGEEVMEMRPSLIIINHF